MTDFSGATLSLREPLTRVPDGDARVEALLLARDALYSSSPLSNPILAVSKIDDWPDAELMTRLSREAAKRDIVRAPAYFQVALPGAAAPTERPEGVTFLGYDVTDGTDSYLLDYGVMSLPVGVPEEHLNGVGLFDRLEEAAELVQTLTREWRLAPASRPQVVALYRVVVPD